MAPVITLAKFATVTTSPDDGYSFETLFPQGMEVNEKTVAVLWDTMIDFHKMAATFWGEGFDKLQGEIDREYQVAAKNTRREYRAALKVPGQSQPEKLRHGWKYLDTIVQLQRTHKEASIRLFVSHAMTYGV